MKTHAHTAIQPKHTGKDQAGAHLTKCSNYGRGRKAEQPHILNPFEALIKQHQCQHLCSDAFLGYN